MTIWKGLGFQALGKEYHIRFMHGSHRKGSHDLALVIRQGDDFLALCRSVLWWGGAARGFCLTRPRTDSIILLYYC